MAYSLKELYEHKKEIELDLQKIERAYDKAKTNHILHLLLSIITAGFWLIIWIFIANTNIRKRMKLEKLIDESKSTLIEIDRKLIPEAISKDENKGQKTTIVCPWCSEEILEKAVICKHCGKEVNVS